MSDEQAIEEFEREHEVTREVAGAVLRRLGEGVAAGVVRLDDGGLAVTVPQHVDLDLEFEDEEGEQELEVELEWDAGNGDAAEDGETEDGAGEESEEGEAAEDIEDAEEEPSEEATTDGDSIAPSALVEPGAETERDSTARFELYRDDAGDWRWDLVHDNGNVIADSNQGYDRKADARKGLESVMTNALGAVVVERETVAGTERE